MTGALGIAICVAIFYVVVAVILAYEMHHTPPVDHLTEAEVEQDVLHEQFDRITEGLGR
jgi:Tfp pilus assembly protein PilO